MSEEVKQEVIDAETVEKAENDTTNQSATAQQSTTTQQVPPTNNNNNGNVPPNQGPKIIYVERPRKPFPWKAVAKYCVVFLVAGLCGFGGGLLAQHVSGDVEEQYSQHYNNNNNYDAYPDFPNYSYGNNNNGNSNSDNSQQENTNQAALGISVIEQDDSVYIAGFSADSNAESAGLKINDKIVAIDGKDLSTYNEIVDYLSTKEVGDVVTVTVERNGEEKDIQVELSQRSTQSALPSSGEQSVY